MIDKLDFIKRHFFSLLGMVVFFSICITIVFDLYSQGIGIPVLFLIGLSFLFISLLPVSYIIEREEKYINKLVDEEVEHLHINMAKITNRIKEFNDKL